MLTARPDYEDKTIPAKVFRAITQSRHRISAVVTPQSIGISAVAAALTGVFLSGLFQLRAYQPKPIVAVVARSPKGLITPAIAKASAGRSPASPANGAVPKAVAISPAAKAAKAAKAVTPTPKVLSGSRSTARYWREDDDDDERDDRRGHGKGRGKYKPHKHKGKHGKGKHGH